MEDFHNRNVSPPVIGRDVVSAMQNGERDCSHEGQANPPKKYDGDRLMDIDKIDDANTDKKSCTASLSEEVAGLTPNEALPKSTASIMDNQKERDYSPDSGSTSKPSLYSEDKETNNRKHGAAADKYLTLENNFEKLKIEYKHNESQASLITKDNTNPSLKKNKKEREIVLQKNHEVTGAEMSESKLISVVDKDKKASLSPHYARLRGICLGTSEYFPITSIPSKNEIQKHKRCTTGPDPRLNTVTDKKTIAERNFNRAKEKGRDVDINSSHEDNANIYDLQGIKQNELNLEKLSDSHQDHQVKDLQGIRQKESYLEKLSDSREDHQIKDKIMKVDEKRHRNILIKSLENLADRGNGLGSKGKPAHGISCQESMKYVAYEEKPKDTSEQNPTNGATTPQVFPRREDLLSPKHDLGIRDDTNYNSYSNADLDDLTYPETEEESSLEILSTNGKGNVDKMTQLSFGEVEQGPRTVFEQGPRTVYDKKCGNTETERKIHVKNEKFTSKQTPAIDKEGKKGQHSEDREYNKPIDSLPRQFSSSSSKKEEEKAFIVKRADGDDEKIPTEKALIGKLQKSEKIKKQSWKNINNGCSKQEFNDDDDNDSNNDDYEKSRYLDHRHRFPDMFSQTPRDPEENNKRNPAELVYTKLSWKSYIEAYSNLSDWEADVKDPLERLWARSIYSSSREVSSGVKSSNID
ncbi:hypothetical protein SK128_001624 [Halocaridina rubra]|uniref:Uncharacterized protein n=1 Tax=Halocaridina rubra TaxID=373956 RepID=A0AAN9A0F6_HALRR